MFINTSLCSMDIEQVYKEKNFNYLYFLRPPKDKRLHLWFYRAIIMYNKQQMVYEFRQLTKIKFRKGFLLKLQRDLLIELLTFLH